MEKTFWQDIADKILQKERAVAARNAGKIPYTAKNGVFDDMAETNLCWWTNGFYAGLLWQLYGWSREEIFRTAAQTIEEKLDQNLLTAQGMDHDSGFKWLLTSVASYRLTGSEASKTAPCSPRTILRAVSTLRADSSAHGTTAATEGRRAGRSSTA